MKKFKRFKHNKEDDLFVVGLFLGLGIGLITGHVAGYLMIGLALGFLLRYFASRNRK